MPIEERWPLAELAPAVRDYAASSGGRVTLAYVGISGVNMSRQSARDLAGMFAGTRVEVNLIYVNDPAGKFEPPSEGELHEFRDELSKFSIPVVRRYAGGRDICAACGTLAATRQGGEVL